MIPAEMKKTLDSLRYYWSDGYEHEVVLGPKALEMKANVNAVCDAYERLANLMPGIYAAVVQAKAYMTPDTKKGAEAQQMLHEVFREIRNLPESH